MADSLKYDIALSFAGEDRYYVEPVAEILKCSNIEVFYDKFNESDLWGKNLYTHLDDVYKNQAKYTIMFCSKDYKDKLWTNHERESAQERAFLENSEYILPARFDDTEIPGIRKTVAYVNLREKTTYEFCYLICKKLNKKIIPLKELDTSLNIEANTTKKAYIYIDVNNKYPLNKSSIDELWMDISYAIDTGSKILFDIKISGEIEIRRKLQEFVKIGNLNRSQKQERGVLSSRLSQINETKEVILCLLEIISSKSIHSWFSWFIQEQNFTSMLAITVKNIIDSLEEEVRKEFIDNIYKMVKVNIINPNDIKDYFSIYLDNVYIQHILKENNISMLSGFTVYQQITTLSLELKGLSEVLVPSILFEYALRQRKCNPQEFQNMYETSNCWYMGIA